MHQNGNGDHYRPGYGKASAGTYLLSSVAKEADAKRSQHVSTVYV